MLRWHPEAVGSHDPIEVIRICNSEIGVELAPYVPVNPIDRLQNWWNGSCCISSDVREDHRRWIVTDYDLSKVSNESMERDWLREPLSPLQESPQYQQVRRLR